MNSRFRDRESILHDRSRRRDVCKRYLTLALGERRLCENAADEKNVTLLSVALSWILPEFFVV